MLTLNILPICKARSIRYPFAYLKKSGFAHSAAHQIVAGTLREPKLAHIEKLCILLECVPHDILEWTPGENQSLKIPLAALIPKKETGFEWMQELKNLPLEKLRELGVVVKGELQKGEE